MKVNSKYFIAGKKKSKNIITNMFSITGVTQELIPSDSNYSIALRILKTLRSRSFSTVTKNNAIKRYLASMSFTDDQIAERLITDEPVAPKTTVKASTETNPAVIDKNMVKKNINKLIKFFSEFSYSPSFRFINSFVLSSDKRKYVHNYFMVQDHPYTTEISDKIKSDEFTEIINSFNGCIPNPINTRFELFFGEPGTGKTTKAMEIASKCVVCSSDMLPADLMQNFVFKDGKADFDKSDLWIAMEEGEKIVLDEVNMLPFESLRFLQGITDGKKTLNYKGHTINIHPEFKIYATMNLNVNGQCIPLPAPLVDRSYEIHEFKLSADDLLSAVI